MLYHNITPPLEFSLVVVLLVERIEKSKDDVKNEGK